METFAWETEAGFAVHALNYTNPPMHRRWIREFVPIGPQEVTMKLPAGRRLRRVELLRAEKDVPVRVADGAIPFPLSCYTVREVLTFRCTRGTANP